MKKILKIFLFAAMICALLSVFFLDIKQYIFAFGAALLSLISLLLLITEKKQSPDTLKKTDIKEKVIETPSVLQNQNNNTVNNIKEFSFNRDELNKEKIAVLNKFASVTSHDIKNPLASLKNIAYYFTNSVKIDGEVPNKMLRMLASEVSRMDNMIVDLLDSTRVKQLNPVKARLDIIINEIVESEKTENIIFATDLKSLEANIDKDRFAQVIKSIIKNAKESMVGDNGKVYIKLFDDGTNAIIEISDTGKGMDKDTLEKCFDPMFSTKQARALGMSLTVSKQIINMLDGEIKAESILGSGSVFTIRLPLAV